MGGGSGGSDPQRLLVGVRAREDEGEQLLGYRQAGD